MRKVVEDGDGGWTAVEVPDEPRREETDADRSRRRSSPDWQRK